MDAGLIREIRTVNRTNEDVSAGTDNSTLLADELLPVRKMIKQQQREKILKYHYATCQRPRTQLKSGRWYTYVEDPSRTNNRRELRAKTGEALDDKVVSYYMDHYVEETLTLEDVFESWLEYKSKRKQNKEETLKQNRNSFAKYVRGTKLADIPLQKMKTADVEDWAIDLLSTYSMTASTFNNHKICVTGPLAYAVRQGYISDNPWKKEKLEYQQLFKSKRRKKSEDAVFYPDEIEELVGEFERGYEVNRNTANLGLEMNFELGLRIGELAALKWKDINWINRTVFIQREEDSSGAVEEYVKSDSPAGYRELALTDAAVSILKRLKSDTRVMGEYIFVHADGTRKTAMQFAGRL